MRGFVKTFIQTSVSTIKLHEFREEILIKPNVS